ncbi:MAG TPA: PilZ domain-containing protein [Archangium sp.]|jgi:hypothetical protein|uniref:PilZ domain-containing protein n=1 Tax=Archangium sp. TaxID=1872627 RepID=UPI002ED99D5B
MSFDHEQRRHRRYPLRLAITLYRGGEEVDADIINASEGGCLLLVPYPLEPGEDLVASIPPLLISRTKVHVVRCESTPEGYTAAVCFETLGIEDSLSRLSDDASAVPGTKKPSLLN